ncbi:hypothetical protein EW15_0865 [Prochlorococcus sp. MIT 0801]|nr:hypothetical protein EW15_0865 [Prochlorococcus sp. MIT 0801]
MRISAGVLAKTLLAGSTKTTISNTAKIIALKSEMKEVFLFIGA